MILQRGGTGRSDRIEPVLRSGIATLIRRAGYPSCIRSGYDKSMSQMPDISAMRRVLKDVFGFEDFRPGQEAVMTNLLAGRPVLAVMPTGAGKSLCYQVPALVLGGLTVVVSPLVA